MSPPSTASRARRVRQTLRSGVVVRSTPRAATATARALLILVGRPTSAADLSEALGVHWRTGYRTIQDLREVVPVRQQRQRGAGDSREPGRYWIARVDLDRAISALRSEP